jgi:Ca2+-binding EF-hand superfamily protein
MKKISHRCTLLTCGLALVALPSAFANGSAGKFKQLDADGDGRVSRQEHAAGAQLMFQQMDTNGDGIVTAAELAVKTSSNADSSARESASTRGNPEAAEADAAARIRLIDQDGDGKVTAAEHAAGASAMFSRLDADGDGYVTAGELEAA